MEGYWDQCIPPQDFRKGKKNGHYITSLHHRLFFSVNIFLYVCVKGPHFICQDFEVAIQTLYTRFPLVFNSKPNNLSSLRKLENCRTPAWGYHGTGHPRPSSDSKGTSMLCSPIIGNYRVHRFAVNPTTRVSPSDGFQHKLPIHQPSQSTEGLLRPRWG